MMELLLKVCFSFLKIGAFSFGGGYAVLAFIQREVVDGHGWIKPDDFVNIVAIAEMTPGPIAVNSSTFVGYNLFGIPGGIICSICTLLVPFILALIVSVYFTKFKAMVWKFKINPIITLIVCGVLGAGLYGWVLPIIGL